MNLTLLWKEIRGLALCFWLSAGLSFVFIGYALFTGFPDLPETEWPLIELEGVFLFALLVGARTLTQERDEGTEAFLDGLPICRTAVFAHKTLAALLTIAAILLLDLILGHSLRQLSRTSLDAPLEWAAIPTQFGLPMLLASMIIALAMLASNVRGYFPLISGLILAAFVLIRARGGDVAGWIDSHALFDVGNKLPVHAMVGHSLVTAVALLLGWMVFCWREGQLSQKFSRLANTRWSRWLGWPVKLGGVAVWIGVIMWFGATAASDEEDGQPPEATAAGTAGGSSTANTGIDTFSQHLTEYYEVIYRSSQDKQLQPLFGGMDAIHQQVTQFFQAPPAPGSRIVLDMASIVSRHAAGQTNWTKIRIPYHPSMQGEEFDRILRHETAHVYIEQLSDGAASTYFEALRTFHEGIATAVELSGIDAATHKERLRMERTAILSNSLQAVPLEALLDNDELGETRVADFLVYSLGLVFADALRDVGGAELPRRLLESLHRDPPPPRASPSEIWQHLLQNCGTSFDHVIATYQNRLQTLEERERKFLGKFSIITATTTSEDGHIVITPETDRPLPKGFRIVLAMEQDNGISTEVQFVAADDDGRFRIDAPANGKPLRYALGWQAKAIGLPSMQPWAEADTKPISTSD